MHSSKLGKEFLSLARFNGVPFGANAVHLKKKGNQRRGRKPCERFMRNSGSEGCKKKARVINLRVCPTVWVPVGVGYEWLDS